MTPHLSTIKKIAFFLTELSVYLVQPLLIYFIAKYQVVFFNGKILIPLLLLASYLFLSALKKAWMGLSHFLLVIVLGNTLFLSSILMLDKFSIASPIHEVAVVGEETAVTFGYRMSPNKLIFEVIEVKTENGSKKEVSVPKDWSLKVVNHYSYVDFIFFFPMLVKKNIPIGTDIYTFLLLYMMMVIVILIRTKSEKLSPSKLL